MRSGKLTVAVILGVIAMWVLAYIANAAEEAKAEPLAKQTLQIESSTTVGPISVTGAGATFPYPMYSKWFDTYHKLHPDIEINYQSIGSGGGIRQVTEGTVDFGATDGPMDDNLIKAFKEKRSCNILHFPTVLGAVVPTYNVPGINEDIKFTPDALAGIFLGTITKWNDPAIQAANPDLKLPAQTIVVVHRSDGSGTTYIWVDYLSKVSKAWKEKVGVGTSVKWPVGLGGKGNEGVSGLVKQTPNSIGYVELIYAVQTKLPYGAVQNGAGKFIKADLKSVTAAAGAAKDMPDDFRVSITNAPGDATYSIASFTWLLVPDQIKDESKRQAIVGFLNWMLGDGQKMTESLEYAPLPKEVVEQERKAVEKIRE
jgi:phosphate transport system substrate-binding protein